MVNLKKAKILLTGGYGFLGQHVYTALLQRGVPARSIARHRRADADLRDFTTCEKVTKGKDLVIHLAANFDGLKYNMEHAGEVFYDNAVMGLHLLEASRRNKVQKLVVAGTVSSYPATAHIPFREEEFWEGRPEKGNASYGLAKRMLAEGIGAYKQQYGFVGNQLLLTNMYGPGDEFDFAHANVVAALIRRCIEAKERGVPEIVMWGSGRATREFLYVEDAARAVVLAAQRYELPDPVNIGSGKEERIKTLAETISGLVGYRGRLVWDKTKPEGAARRVSDVSRAQRYFAFAAKTNLAAGLKKTIQWHLRNRAA